MLLVVCVILVYAYFGVEYMGQLQKQQTVTNQISDVSRALALLPQLPKDLEKRLADAQQANAEAKESMSPGTVNTTEEIAIILREADANQVKITPVTTRPWSERIVGERTFRVFCISLGIEGELPHLLSLIERLEEREFQSLVIDNLIITKSSDEAAAPAAGTLDLAIYTLLESSE